MENAFSRRAGHASISTLDVRTGRLQWRTALYWRGHHKIEYTLQASPRQVRPQRAVASASADDLNRKRNAADKNTRATMEHGHVGGNLYAAVGSGDAGSQGSGHFAAVRPD
jgi:hypothetical protein